MRVPGFDSVHEQLRREAILSVRSVKLTSFRTIPSRPTLQRYYEAGGRALRPSYVWPPEVKRVTKGDLGSLYGRTPSLCGGSVQ